MNALLRWRHLRTHGHTRILAVDLNCQVWAYFFVPHEISLKFRMASGATLKVASGCEISAKFRVTQKEQVKILYEPDWRNFLCELRGLQVAPP